MNSRLLAPRSDIDMATSFRDSCSRAREILILLPRGGNPSYAVPAAFYLSTTVPALVRERQAALGNRLAHDPVGEDGKGVKRLTISSQFYDEARHELVNETNRKRVTEELIGWLLQFAASEDPT